MDNANQEAQNIISMTDYQPETGYGAIAQVEAYWHALRGTRLMPKRSEIDPRGIELALEYTFILERIAPGIARLRIAGSHLNDLMGMEVRGMPLTMLFQVACRRRIADTLEDIFQTPASCQIRMEAEPVHGQRQLDARMIMLPLKSDLGDVSRVLGCFMSRGERRQTGPAFAITSLDLRPLLPQETMLPQPPDGVEAHRQDQNPVPGFAAPTTPFSGQPPKGRPPYLRLVKSDREE